MKRPLFVFGITYLISTVVCVYFLSDFSFICGGICFAVGTLSWVFLQSKKFSGIFLMAGICAFSFYLHNLNINNVEHLFNKDIVMEGIVTDIIPAKTGEFLNVKGKIIGEDTETTAQIFNGNHVIVDFGETVNISFKDDRNFMNDNILRSQKVYLRGFGTSVLPIDNTDISPYYKLKSYFYNLRAEVKTIIDRNFWNSTKGFIFSSLSGDDTLMETDLHDALADSGIIHITAVSGIHLMIFYLYAQFLCRKLDFSKKISLVVCSVFLIIYSLFCVSAYSVFRSLGMILILILARFSRRVYDSRTALGFVAILFLAINPYAVCDAGFMLSFGGTLGILLFYNNIFLFLGGNPNGNHRKISTKDKFKNKILAPLSVGLSANVFIIPLMILFFAKINTYSVIATLVVSWIIPFLFVTFPLFLLEVYVLGKGLFVAFAINMAVKFVIKIAFFVKELPLSIIYVWDKNVMIFIGVLFLTGYLLWYFKARNKSVILVFCSVIMAFSSGYLLLEGQDNYYKIGVFDDCVLLTTGEKNIIIGNIKNVYEAEQVEFYMLRENINSIDFQIIDKKLTKSSAANQYLIKNEMVNTVFISDEAQDYIKEIEKIMTDRQKIIEFDELNITLQDNLGKCDFKMKELNEHNKNHKNKCYELKVGNIKFLKLADKCDIIDTSSNIFKNKNYLEQVDSTTGILPYKAVICAIEHHKNERFCNKPYCLNCNIIENIFEDYDGIFAKDKMSAVKKKKGLKAYKTFTGQDIILIKK